MPARGIYGHRRKKDTAGAMDESEAGDHSAAAPAPAADVAELSSRGGPESEEPSFQYSALEWFECCVCLELIYKPIVLVCGHISCFWCVHRAMDGVMESHCPICRQPYKYFPAICQLLHNLLQKIDPAAYREREKEVLDIIVKIHFPRKEKNPPVNNEFAAKLMWRDFKCFTLIGKIEEAQECFSPMFVDQITEGAPLVEHKLSHAPQENGSADLDGLAVDGQFTSKDRKLLEDGTVCGISQDLCVSDALCAACKQLLFEPAGLNCGHVYCQPCLLNLGSETLRCQICQSVHPGDLPKTCIQVRNFLEKKFPREYALRRESFADLSACGCKANMHEHKLANDKHLSSVEDMLKIHARVGCDSCGMYPIVGKRYKCKDCKEKIGFDLCESCYNTRSKLPARFNQQHTPDHTFEVDESMVLSRFYTRVLRRDFEDVSRDSAESETPDEGASS